MEDYGIIFPAKLNLNLKFAGVMLPIVSGKVMQAGPAKCEKI